MELQRDLVILGESVERVYGYFANERLLVNRKYQRKLVWTVEEKKSFVDSILNGFPVPLILMAEVTHEEKRRFEIVDGMQRLNAIVAFIEGEFDFEGAYFDLNTMAESKLRLDEGLLIQKEPFLNRETCTKIASYTLPLSFYSFEGAGKIDEIFRRINSNGRYLSRQEIRQAGATAQFSQLVRDLSSSIRGDMSHTDKLLLNNMKEISITNRNLPYGINVDTIFWVSQGILRRENVRSSRDEEIVADILAYMALTPKPRSSSNVLDDYYGIGEDDTKSEDIEIAIKKIGSERLHTQFLAVFEELRNILSHSSKPFHKLISQEAESRLPRHFQVIFLALYELLVNKNMRPASRLYIVEKLDGIGRHISIGEGGGNWSAKNRQDNVNSISGILQSAFVPRDIDDPALNSWSVELENILMQSFTEQALYDFKVGLHRLDSTEAFDTEAALKILKTLTAMANHGPGNVGYVILGVADGEAHAKQHESFYKTKPIQFRKFFITGIDAEASKHNRGLDGYLQRISQILSTAPVNDTTKKQIARDMRMIQYFDKSLLILQAKANDEPSMFDGKFYERHGTNNVEIPVEQYGNLFKRFFR